MKKLAGFFGLDYYDGDNRIIHSLRTAIVDPDGRVVKVFEGNEWTVEDVMRELRAAKPAAARVRPNDAPAAPVALLLALIGVLMPAAAARADFLPSRPIAFWNDRLVISGDATVTIGQPDHGYFNSLDYYHDALNLARFGLSIELKVNERIAVLGQVIDQIALRSGSSADAWSDETPPPIWDPFETNRHIVRPYALFVRVRPFLDKPITVQAGRIPPVFGAYVTQEYGAAQPLISLPLAYHYPTTLRPDAVVRSSAALARWRGGGWRVRYRTGSDNWGQGVPLVNALRWDTGVQVKVGDGGPIEVSGAVTNGTLSSPRFEDDNDGKQISGRVVLRPATGLVLGVSGARGDFLSDGLIAALPAELAGRSYTQQAFGADVEYSRGYWLRAIRDDRQLVADARARSAVSRQAAARVVDVPRRTLSPDAAALRRGARRVSRVLEDSGRRGIRQPARHVGRAGHARGDRHGLFDSAQRAPQAGVSIRLARGRHDPPPRRAGDSDRLLVLATT